MAATPPPASSALGGPGKWSISRPNHPHFIAPINPAVHGFPFSSWRRAWNPTGMCNPPESGSNKGDVRDRREGPQQRVVRPGPTPNPAGPRFPPETGLESPRGCGIPSRGPEVRGTGGKAEGQPTGDQKRSGAGGCEDPLYPICLRRSSQHPASGTRAWGGNGSSSRGLGLRDLGPPHFGRGLRPNGAPYPTHNGWTPSSQEQTLNLPPSRPKSWLLREPDANRPAPLTHLSRLQGQMRSVPFLGETSPRSRLGEGEARAGSSSSGQIHGSFLPAASSGSAQGSGRRAPPAAGSGREDARPVLACRDPRPPGRGCLSALPQFCSPAVTHAADFPSLCF